jgi:hypothetical protein
MWSQNRVDEHDLRAGKLTRKSAIGGYGVLDEDDRTVENIEVPTRQPSSSSTPEP